MKGTNEGERLTFVFHSANIHYDLLRTGSVELTTNKILERGFLDAVRARLSSLIRPYSFMLLQPPEAYFTLYPRQSDSDVVPRPAGAQTAARAATTATQARAKETLISRYGLESRLSGADDVPSPQQDAGGRAVWEETVEKREASLRERKAQMILAARQYVPSFFSYITNELTIICLSKANAGRTTDTIKIPCCMIIYPLSCLSSPFSSTSYLLQP